MPEEVTEPKIYTTEEVKKLLEDTSVSAAMKAGAVILENFVRGLLDVRVETDNAAARIGGEAVLKKIVASGLDLAKQLREQAEDEENKDNN